MRPLSLIAAVAADGVIGRNGKLPWHLPEDLRRFQRLTTGCTVIMGRVTWESLPARPLPGRTNVVLSAREGYQAPGATVVSALEAALSLPAPDQESFVIGGAQIFALFLPLATKLYLTRVHASLEGDARFPPFDEASWPVLERIPHPRDARHPFDLTFEVRVRRG